MNKIPPSPVTTMESVAQDDFRGHEKAGQCGDGM